MIYQAPAGEQQYQPGGFQPVQPPGSRKAQRRVISRICLGVIIAGIAVAIVAALSGGSKPSDPAPSRQTVAEHVKAWYDNGGQAGLNNLTGTFNQISADVRAGNVTAVGNDCSALAADVTSIQSIGPIPYGPAETWFARALSLYGGAAANCQAGASSGNIIGVLLSGSASEFTQGNTDLGNAVAAIKALSGAGQ